MKLSQTNVLLCCAARLYGPRRAAEPSPAVVVASLAALADQAGRSHVRVKMQPGVYLLNDAKLLRSAEIKHPEAPGKVAGQYRINCLLHFAGNDSSYDLTGGVIEIDDPGFACLRRTRQSLTAVSPCPGVSLPFILGTGDFRPAARPNMPRLRLASRRLIHKIRPETAFVLCSNNGNTRSQGGVPQLRIPRCGGGAAGFECVT
jgi:hypothetical protein